VLRGHRHAARLTLEQLAQVSGVSARTLSDMERGRSKGPQHRTVTALADALVLDDDARKQLIELARDGRLRDYWTRPAGLCELPRLVDDFTGRAAELDWITELAYADNSKGAGVAGLITSSGGMGKTTLAVRAAHALRPSFPGGVFFLDLLGMAPQPVAAGDALRLLLRALGVPDKQVPGAIRERASLYRSLLRDRRALVVLDNAGSEEQVRPLLPGEGPARTLITAKRLLAGLEGVRRLALRPLDLPEATELLTAIVGDRAASDGEPALTRLAGLCDGLPLALRIIGNRLASRPGWDAVELATRLADEEHHLDQFAAGDLQVASAFGMSYEQLAEPARRMFRRLAVVAGRDFDAALAAVAGQMSAGDAWDALDELVDLDLLQDSAAGRYRFHDLVRRFAGERLDDEESPAERAALTARLTSWLLRMAIMAGRWFEPGFGRPAGPDPDLAVLSSAADAESWLRADADNWLAALRSAAASGQHALVLDCAESMHWFSDRWPHAGHWHEVFSLGSQAAAAAGDLARQAAQLNYLAWVYSVPPGDPEAMLRSARQALDLATRGGASAQVAASHQATGQALLALGRPDEAVASASAAAETFRSLGDVGSYVQCLSLIGLCRRDQGRYREALDYFGQALALIDDEQSGMTPAIAAQRRPYALLRAGQCLGALGRRDEAITTLTEAAGLMETLHPDFRQAETLESLASLLAEDGRADESRRTYARAAQVFRAIDDAEASTRCDALAGNGSLYPPGYPGDHPGPAQGAAIQGRNDEDQSSLQPGVAGVRQERYGQAELH
jgi:tetratricopeptide (TPR) repeat protein/transcriptional regulator with XRE-family HTH domain